MDTFSNRLKAIMAEKNLKQIDVIRLVESAGKESGIKIGKSHMSQYISGKTVPRQDIMSVLAKALVPILTMLSGRRMATSFLH